MCPISVSPRKSRKACGSFIPTIPIPMQPSILPIGLQRLLQLATHLESGKLGHERFDFNQYTDPDRKYRGCGTAGCALGECPTAFPNDWGFRKVIGMNNELQFLPVLVIDSIRFRENAHPLHSAEDFFGLTDPEVCHLFLPNEQSEKYGETTLTEGASELNVAKNIRDFVRDRVRDVYPHLEHPLPTLFADVVPSPTSLFEQPQPVTEETA